MMEGSKTGQLALTAFLLVYQRHAVKHVARLLHISARSVRRALTRGYLPDRIMRWALPIADEVVERRLMKLELVHRDIGRAEIALGLRPVPIPLHRRA